MAKPNEPQSVQNGKVIGQSPQRLKSVPGRFVVSPDKISRWARKNLGPGQKVEALNGDGGRRRYFRLKGRGRLVLAGPDPAENLAWLRIGRHLWFKSLPLPRIEAHDLSQGLFLLEDLGDELLARQPRKDLYFQAVELAARIHQEGSEGFDYRWSYQGDRYSAAMAEHDEIAYFLRQLVSGYFKFSRLPEGIKAEAQALASLAVSGREAWVLMHRDFQGRNLIDCRGRLWVLDWQGARLGPAVYDLSSLMEECSTCRLSDGLKDELLRHYLKIRRLLSRHKFFQRELAVVGAVRMMQALGAYGKFSLEGKNKFKAFIAPGLDSLAGMFRREELSPFPLLRAVIEETALMAGPANYTDWIK